MCIDNVISFELQNKVEHSISRSLECIGKTEFRELSALPKVTQLSRVRTMSFYPEAVLFQANLSVNHQHSSKVANLIDFLIY